VNPRIAAAAVLLAAGCATGRPPSPTTGAATPVATPLPTPLPPRPPAAALPAEDTDPPLIRVLLDRGSEAVELPQPGRAYRASWEGGADWVWGPLVVDVVGDDVWQVGAFRGRDAAREVEERLRRELGSGIDTRSILGDGGLLRVQVVWGGRAPDDAAELLTAAGFSDAFPVAGGDKVVVRGTPGLVESSSEVMIEPQGGWPTAFDGRRFRGRLRVRSVGSELLVINELNLERYLMGVVPVEMGPSVFPELEALKAQAVAARTYAVAHLGDHDDNGYDICGTPACQAYHGADAEHPLSNRAVEETAGIVAVFGGAPIDAMYTSTCGGHTEDAGLLFPDRAQQYLRGVACAWERPLDLDGDGPQGGWLDRPGFHATVARELLGLGADAAPDDLVRAVHDRTGVSADAMESRNRDSFAAALLSAAGIHAPQGFTRATTAYDTLMVLSDLYDLDLPPSEGLDGDWPAAAALAALELRGDVVRDRGEAVPHPEGVAIYPRRAEASEILPSPVPLWERWGSGYRRVDHAELLPGTELERLRAGGLVVAVVVRRSGGSADADRRSAWRSWVRDREWDDIAARLGIPDLERLTITRRGVSGRVVEMVAVGRSGSSRRLEGFPIRTTLGLPENLFTFHVFSSPEGTRTVRFLGRGWGHGVGLCQNGSYGLARAGRSYVEILETYYTGVVLQTWSFDGGTEGSPEGARSRP